MQAPFKVKTAQYLRYSLLNQKETSIDYQNKALVKCEDDHTNKESTDRIGGESYASAS